MEGLEIHAFTGSEGAALRLNGRLDGNTAPAFDKKLDACVENASKPVILDFEGVDFVSSAGLRSLLKLAKRLQSGGGAITVANPQPMVREVFEISGFDSLFQHAKSMAAALSSVGLPPDFCGEPSEKPNDPEKASGFLGAFPKLFGRRPSDP